MSKLEARVGSTAIQNAGIDELILYPGKADLPNPVDMSGRHVPLMQLMTAKAATGTSVDFSPTDGTGVPSWAKRITVLFNIVSTNGTSLTIAQLGTGSFQTTSYLSSGAHAGGTNSVIGQGPLTNGLWTGGGNGAANAISGALAISLVGGNVWIASGSGGVVNTNFGFTTGGNVNLSAQPDRIRITTVNGTDAFDAGTISVLYEG